MPGCGTRAAERPTQAAGGEETVFDARVELDAGPFSDFAALSAFERSLAHLPKVEDVYVRRLADDRALIELTLSEPAPLLDTMRASLPYSLDVRSASHNKIVVNVAVQQPTVSVVKRVTYERVRAYRTVAAVKHYRKRCCC